MLSDRKAQLTIMNQRIRFLVSTLAYTRFDHNLQYRQGEYNVVDHKNVFKLVITLRYCYVFTFSIFVRDESSQW